MRAADSIRALVSIHDVMPGTLDLVQSILDLCAEIHSEPGPLTLLVVPGLDWDSRGVERLRDWQAQGHRLAAHGWLHRVERFGGLAHRLHGLLISRRVAEHLALDATGIARLMHRSADWFLAQGLEAPSLYVPPAWALGALRPEALAGLPFERCEVLSGVWGPGGLLHPLPLLGYECDGLLRVAALTLWNRINRGRAESSGWLRIGIHPQDLGLGLAGELRQDLARYPNWVCYDALPR